MNQAHPGKSQFDPEIDHFINRLKDIDDQDYEKMTGPWSEVFPNPNPAPQKWPEGTDKPSDGHKWPKITIVRNDENDDNHTASVKIASGCTHDPNMHDKANGYQNCMWCVETGDCDGKPGECGPHSYTWHRENDMSNWMFNDGAFNDEDTPRRYHPAEEEFKDDFEKENGYTLKHFMDSWKESSKLATRYVTCDECDEAENLMDWEGGTSVSPNYNRLLGEGGWRQHGYADYCNDCQKHYCQECGDPMPEKKWGGKCGDYENCNTWEDSNDKIEEDFANKWKNSSKVNVLTVCDGCGAKSQDNYNPFNEEWESEGDKDYCPECAYKPCYGCDCDDDYPEIDHLSSCRRFEKSGNCACPPCGCDCHE